eukprot:54013-Chlamydomonas_euryale.AAC.1
MSGRRALTSASREDLVGLTCCPVVPHRPEAAAEWPRRVPPTHPPAPRQCHPRNASWPAWYSEARPARPPLGGPAATVPKPPKQKDTGTGIKGSPA